MTQRDSFDDILDAAIDALRGGATREQALAAAGGSSAHMGSLVETAALLRAVPPVPSPARLGDHYAIVRAAVERAQITRSEMIPSDPTPAPRWWQRRFSIASLSVPAGIVAAMALFGFAAAAGGAVMTTGVGQDIAESVRPAWVNDLVGNDDADDDTPGPGDEPRNGNDPSAAPGLGGESPPGSDNGPQLIVLSGTVSDVNGNTFTLTADDREWHVQIDSNTTLTGEILDGATATVEGDITAEKNLHATSLSASGGTPAEEPGKPVDPGQPGEPGQPQDPVGREPEPKPTRTPNENQPQNDDVGPPATPPGSSGGPQGGDRER